MANDLEQRFLENVENIKTQSEDETYQTLEFNEERHFPFKKKPVLLNGTIRIWKDHASSIHYPEKGIVIISTQESSIYRKINSNGKSTDRNIPSSRSDFNDILRALFALDFEALKESFNFKYSESEGQTCLTLIPIQENESKIQHLALALTSEAITQIEIGFGKGKKTVISPLSKAVLPEGFTNDEIENYFITSEE